MMKNTKNGRENFMNATKRWLMPAFLATAQSMWSGCVGILLMAALPSASLATETYNAVVTTDKPAKGPKNASPKNKTAKKPPSTGSTETPSQRDHRLWRECRGKPNAGACEGFAS
jgi:hypothetical protein